MQSARFTRLFLGTLAITFAVIAVPGVLKSRARNPAQPAPRVPALRAFEPPPASAPSAPFRVIWQQIDANDARLSSDWKFLALKGRASSLLVSTQTGRVVNRVPNPVAQFPLAVSPQKLTSLPPKIQEAGWKSDMVEAHSTRGALVAMRKGNAGIFNLKTGRCLWTLKVPEYGPRVFLGFSPDGKWIITREGDKWGQNERHFLRAARTGAILRRFAWKSSRNRAPFGWSPDGKRFGVVDRGAKFYAMPSGKLLAQIDGSTYGADAVEFSRDGREIVTADGGDETVARWNIATGRVTRRWTAFYNASGDLKISNDGQKLAAGSDGSCGRDLMRVWDFKTVKEVWKRPSGYNNWGVSAVAWSPDGTLLASASANGPPQIWDAQNGKQLAAPGGVVTGRGRYAGYLDSQKGSEPTLFWSSDARELWVGGKDGIAIWSREGQKLREISVLKDIVSMARCPSGQRVIVAMGEGEIALLQTGDEKILWRKTVNAPRIGKKFQGTVGVAFLPSNRVISHVNFGPNEGKILVWDARDGFTTQELEAPLGTFRIAVSRDGQRIAAIGSGGISVWDCAPQLKPISAR